MPQSTGKKVRSDHRGRVVDKFYQDDGGVQILLPTIAVRIGEKPIVPAIQKNEEVGLIIRERFIGINEMLEGVVADDTCVDDLYPARFSPTLQFSIDFPLQH